MNIVESATIQGLKVISPTVFRDFRGCFLETFNAENYCFEDGGGKKIQFREDDISISKRHVLRGLHGDTKTWKLVQCLSGKLFYAVVDMRKDSSTFKNVETFVLDDASLKLLLIPAGCVNGHLVLSEKAILSYKQSEIYSGQGKQITVRWNDPSIAIVWPVDQPILSERDANASTLG